MEKSNNNVKGHHLHKVRAEPKRVKCIIAGDSQVGKTALVHSFIFDKALDKSSSDFFPTTRDDYTFCTTLSGGKLDVDLDICDIGGQSSMDRLRPLCYGSAEVIILCFSVVVPKSFSNIIRKWIPELKRHCKGFSSTKILLVGTQSDLRSNVNILLQLVDDGQAPISETRALCLAKKIGAVKYLECSAFTKYNVKKVFEQAMLLPSELDSQPYLLGKGNSLHSATTALVKKGIFSRRWRLRQKSSNKIKRLMFLSCFPYKE